MKAKLFDYQAKNLGDIELNTSVFTDNVNRDLIAQSIRVYLANQRSSHAKAKERSEVAGTTKKMWAQKGTGRARHSSAKAPQFVGGGKAHGPSGDQNYKLELPKKMRANALKSILSLFAIEKSIVVIEDLVKLEAKTKLASLFLDSLTSEVKELSSANRIALVCSPKEPEIKRAFRNIPYVNVLSTASLNVYDLSKNNYLIFTKESLESLTS